MSKTAVGKNILAEAETIVIHLQPMNDERRTLNDVTSEIIKTKIVKSDPTLEMMNSLSDTD